MGTAIYLYGQANTGDYTVQLDGGDASPGDASTPGMLYTRKNLNYTSHTMVFQLLQGSASILSADITVGLGDYGSVLNIFSFIPCTQIEQFHG